MPDQDRLVDFPRLAARLQMAAMVVMAVGVAGAVVDGLLGGLTFSVLLRWAGVTVALWLLVAAVLAARHALSGANRAQREGERLSEQDVGLLPRRRNDQE